MPGQNLVEKIAQKFAVGLDKDQTVRSGDYLSIAPAHVMTHDNSSAVIDKFKAISATRIANPRQVVFALDHDIQNKSEQNLAKYAKIEKFANEMSIDFYPAGRGIGHQIMCEEGYAFPGSMAVASDSHANTYGGLGCLGTPIVRTDAAAIWATGQTWWQVPPVVKVEFTGQLRSGVTGKDVIIALCGYFNNDEVLNHAIEFVGEGVAELPIDQRLTIANMTTEWGALVGLFSVDDVTINWLIQRSEYILKRGLADVPSDNNGNGMHPRLNSQKIKELAKADYHADNDATYAKEITIDLSSIQPYVSGPHNVKTMTPVSEMSERNIKIHKAYLVSCVNSRLEDISAAAKIVKNKKNADGVEFYISAASDEVLTAAKQSGDWQILLESGAIELPPGCGPCIGLGRGTLKDNEIGISATNRNFKGRMGSKSSEVYLASPAVVAASAIVGKIAGPRVFENIAIIAKIKTNIEKRPITDKVKIIKAFPETIEGEIIFCYQDNLNTDGIYPGKYTYRDDFTPEQQAGVVMENYDPEFSKIVSEGDILVGGFNFGTGSSREQAATALKYRGIRMIIAGSFSQTYKRNAINNGFLVIEIPELVNNLKSKLGTDKLTIKTGRASKIDFRHCTLEADNKSYSFNPLGSAAQELIVIDGLENWVKSKL